MAAIISRIGPCITSLRLHCNVSLLLIPLLWCGLVVTSFAQIVESPDPLIGNPEFRILEQFRDNFGWSAQEIRKGQSVLYVFAEGPSYKVVAVGPTTSDPKAYAEKLDAWKSKQGLPGSVQYARQKSASVATYTYSASGFGKSGYSLELPLASLTREVKLEDVTNCALVFFRVTGPPSALPAPTFVGQDGLKYWNLSATPAKSDFRFSEALSGWLLPLFALLTLLPIVGVLYSYNLAKPIRQRTDLTDLDRENLFYKSLQPIIAVTIMLHCFVCLAAIWTRAFDPLVALWFEPSQIGAGMVALTGFAVLPSLLYSFLLRKSYKLEAEAQEAIVASGVPMDDEPVRVRPKASDVVAHLPHLVPLVTLVTASFVPTLPFEWIHSYHSSWGTLGYAGSIFFPTRSDSLTAPSKAVDLPALKQKLAEAFSRVEVLAKNTDKEIQIRRTRIPEFEIYEFSHEFVIPEWWIRRSSVDEIVFSILHKRWFKVQKPLGDTASALLAVAVGAVPFIMFVAPSWVPGATDFMRYASLLLPVIVGIIYWRLYWLNSRAAMFATDTRIIDATQNPGAAISALERMERIESVSKSRLNFPRDPSCRERIERIQERLAQ